LSIAATTATSAIDDAPEICGARVAIAKSHRTGIPAVPKQGNSAGTPLAR